MNELLRKAIFDIQFITDTDVEEALTQICEDEHASCNDRCPVFKKCGGCAQNDESETNGCECYKDGARMLQILRK
jgi:hypothetical protein